MKIIAFATIAAAMCIFMAAGMVLAQESGSSSGQSGGLIEQPYNQADAVASSDSSASPSDSFSGGLDSPSPGPDLRADACSSGMECRWCGHTCGKFPADSICPAVMPPEGYDCVCSSGACSLAAPPRAVSSGSSGAAAAGGGVAPSLRHDTSGLGGSDVEQNATVPESVNEQPEKVQQPQAEAGPQFSISAIGQGFALKSGVAEAMASMPLRSEGGLVYIQSGQKEIEIKVMPDAAAGLVANEVGDISSITLELKDVPVYVVSGSKDGMLLGFIPVKLDMKVKVAADTGEIKSVEKPWWAFLVIL